MHKFDLVISESTTSFMEYKISILNEYKRVTKPGGFVCINEAIWVNNDPQLNLIKLI